MMRPGGANSIDGPDRTADTAGPESQRGRRYGVRESRRAGLPESCRKPARAAYWGAPPVAGPSSAGGGAGVAMSWMRCSILIGLTR